jgi:hypothetical protein
MSISLSRIAGQAGQRINGGDPWSYLWAPIVWQPAALPLLLAPLEVWLPALAAALGVWRPAAPVLPAPLEVWLPALASGPFEASLPVWMTRSPRAEQV